MYNNSNFSSHLGKVKILCFSTFLLFRFLLNRLFFVWRWRDFNSCFWIWWSLWIFNLQQLLYSASFLCLLHGSVRPKPICLHKSHSIIIPTQSHLLWTSFWANLQHSLTGKTIYSVIYIYYQFIEIKLFPDSINFLIVFIIR